MDEISDMEFNLDDEEGYPKADASTCVLIGTGVSTFVGADTSDQSTGSSQTQGLPHSDEEFNDWIRSRQRYVMEEPRDHTDTDYFRLGITFACSLQPSPTKRM